MGELTAQVQSFGFSYAYYYVDDITVILCDTTSFDELQISNHVLQIFPNPAEDQIVFSNYFSSGTISLINIIGHEVYSGNYEREFDISFLPAGLYFIQLTTEEKSIYRARFVKQ